MNTSQKQTEQGVRFSSKECDGYEGWPVFHDRVAIPKDYENRKVISKDDITNLIIDLGILGKFKSNDKDLWDKHIFKNPRLFTTEYKTVFKE